MASLITQIIGELVPLSTANSASYVNPGHPAYQTVELVSANSWQRLMASVSQQAHKHSATEILITLPSENMTIPAAGFAVPAFITGGGGTYTVISTLRNIGGLSGGTYELSSGATTAAITITENTTTSLTLTGEFKSNAASPLIEINAPGEDVAITLRSATLKTATGPVLKVTAANGVTLTLEGKSSVEAGTITSLSGTEITLNRSGTDAVMATQAGIAGTLTGGTYAAISAAIGYTPSSPSNWTGSITAVGPALDELRAAVSDMNPFTVKSLTASDSPYTITTAEDVILVDTSTSGITVKLPTKAAGRRVTVKDKSGNAATNNVTISPTGAGETIDGNANLVLNINLAAVSFVSDGSNWFAY